MSEKIIHCLPIILGRGFLTSPLFYEDPLYCLPPPQFFKFCPTPPTSPITSNTNVLLLPFFD